MSQHLFFCIASIHIHSFHTYNLYSLQPSVPCVPILALDFYNWVQFGLIKSQSNKRTSILLFHQPSSVDNIEMGSAPSSTVKIQQDQASKDLNNNNYHSVHSFDEDQYHSAHSHDEDTIDHNSDTVTANGDGAISSQSQAKERDTSEILIEDVYQNGNALPAQKSVSFQSAGLDGFDDTGSRETSIHGLSVLQKPSISGLESKGKEDVYKSNGKMKDIELVNLQAQQSISNSQKSIKMVSIPRNIMQGGKRARSLASICKCGGCDDFMAKITNGMYYGTIILLMFWIVIIPPYFNPGEICGIYGDCAEEVKNACDFFAAFMFNYFSILQVIALLINFFLLVNDKLNESIRVRIFDQGSENKVRIVIYTNESIEESKILINSYIIQEKKVEALFPA